MKAWWTKELKQPLGFDEVRVEERDTNARDAQEDSKVSSVAHLRYQHGSR
jgi:hypothetical protein